MVMVRVCTLFTPFRRINVFNVLCGREESRSSGNADHNLIIVRHCVGNVGVLTWGGGAIWWPSRLFRVLQGILQGTFQRPMHGIVVAVVVVVIIIVII